MTDELTGSAQYDPDYATGFSLDNIPGFREAQERALPDREAALAICEARARRGWTQKKLAKKLGTTVKVIRRLESGKWT